MNDIETSFSLTGVGAARVSPIRGTSTRAALCLALIVLFTFPAQATPITVTSDLARSFFSEGQTAKGRFNINGALPAGSKDRPPYRITSATATFSVSDDADPYSTWNDVSWFEFVGMVETPAPHWEYWGTQTFRHFDPVEILSVELGSGTTAAQTPYFSQNPVDAGISVYNVVTSPFTWPAVYFVNQYYSYSGYRGSANVTLTLDSTALSDLSNDGILGFDLTCTAGDLWFESATLTADVTLRQSVPEASSLAPLCFGIPALALLAKRKSKKPRTR